MPELNIHQRKRPDEANSAVSLSRRDARVLFGQEVDRTTPRRNATLKMLADCGREVGAKKNSNKYEEYDPAYNICFGENVAHSFSRLPQNSESDRPLIIYLPNKFRDEVDLEKSPSPPRRFRKLDIDEIVSRDDTTWAILVILLRIRRNAPDLDEIIALGAPTSRWWEERWFPNAPCLFADEKLLRKDGWRLRMNECLWVSENGLLRTLAVRTILHRLLADRLGPYLAPFSGRMFKLKRRSSTKGTSSLVTLWIVAGHAWV